MAQTIIDDQNIGVKYCLSLPERSAPENGWPILLFLHGIGEANIHYSTGATQDIHVVKRNESPPELCANQEERFKSLWDSFIVISPQFPSSGVPWHWIHKINEIKRILSHVLSNHSGNRNKVYLTGFSRGGKGAIEIANRINEDNLNAFRVSKLIPVDAESLTNLPDMPTWIHYGGNYRKDQNFPFIGAHQRILNNPNSGSWKIIQENESVPTVKRCFTHWNKDHPGTCKSAYTDLRIYEWLKRNDYDQV